MDEENKVRTASEVILSLEGKVNQLLHISRSLDFNVKVVSNKLNQFIQSLSKSEEENTFSAYDPATMALAPPTFDSNIGKTATIKDIPANYKPNIQDQLQVPRETGLPNETAVVGQARTRRPETTRRPEALTKVPTVPEKTTPTPSIVQPVAHPAKIVKSKVQYVPGSSNRIPVIQRVIDKNNKSIFMADVEILNTDTNIMEMKTRTAGTGKWQGTLSPGKYKITIKKYESLSKQQMETVQNLVIDENTPNELPMLILK